MFSSADAYERFMGRWSRALAPHFVRFAGVQDGEAILDVGCGTGALTSAIAATAPHGRIVGIDPSEPYVAFARQELGGERIRFDVGTARQIPLDTAGVDRTLSMLIFNFVPEPEQAIAEMRRVTRPGGTIAAAVWDYSGGMQMLRAFWDEAVALAGPGAQDEGRMRFCRDGELAAFWRAEGLDEVVGERLTIETPFSSFDDYWRPFLEKQGPAGAFVAALSDPDREALRARLRRRLLGDGPDRPFVLTAMAWGARGRA